MVVLQTPCRIVINLVKSLIKQILTKKLEMINLFMNQEIKMRWIKSIRM
jgi:hypothetical protein